MLIFDIPILAEAHQYNMYEPTPVFLKEEIHMPVLDAHYITNSKTGAKYVSMMEEG